MTGERPETNTRPDPPLRLELEIAHQTPLEGYVSSPSGITRPFMGWAGLASTLTRFIDDWRQPGRSGGDRTE